MKRTAGVSEELIVTTEVPTGRALLLSGSYGLNSICIWEVAVLGIRTRVTRPLGMREAQRVKCRYLRLLWAADPQREHKKDLDKAFEIGRSQVALTLAEAQEAFEQIRQRQVKQALDDVRITEVDLRFYAEKLSKLAESVKYLRDQLERLGGLEFPVKSLLELFNEKVESCPVESAAATT